MKGVLYFIFALLFIIITYDYIGIFGALFTSTLIKVFFYTGVIITYTVQLVVVPMLVITSRLHTQLKQLAYGGVAFVVGILYTLISWYIAPEFIQMMFVDLWQNTTLYSIFWTGLIITWVLALLVVPNLLIFRPMESEDL